MALNAAQASGAYVAYHGHDEFLDLDSFEFEIAWYVGHRIWQLSQAAKRQGRMHDYKAGEDNGERIQCLGSLAERIVAKRFGLYWPAMVNTFHGADLPHNIEVRLIGAESYGLRVYEKDGDKRIVAVVIPKGKESGPYRLPGWVDAEQARRPEWQMDPEGRRHPFYAVPQRKLRPNWELARMIRLERAGQDDALRRGV